MGPGGRRYSGVGGWGWGGRWDSRARSSVRARLSHRQPRTGFLLDACGWPWRGPNSAPRQPPSAAPPDSARQLRPAARFRAAKALPSRALQTCELRHICPDTTGSGLPEQREGRSGGEPGPVRRRWKCPQLTGPGRPKRPSGPQGNPPNAWAVTDSRPWPAPRRGAPGGRPPGGDCEPLARPKRAEHRATPGGYGGKPPGVAIIGAPTGARNAGRCSDGGPEHRFECYYGSPLDAYNPGTHSSLLCATSEVLQNVVRTPDVCAL
jgi:hypothetical protein